VTGHREYHFGVMGSDAHLVLVGGPEGASMQAAQRLHRLERTWSRFDDGSEISRLNRANGRSLPISEDTELLLMAAKTAHRCTGGAFDPTVLPSLRSAGYLDDFSFVAETTSADPLVSVQVPGTAGIEVGDGWARFPAGVEFDPGGIGKGLAADIVVAEFLADGVAGISVNIGGDVVVGGTPPVGDEWHTLARDVTPAGRVISLATGAVATSSIERRAWGADRHHIIDPSDGRPATTGLAAVTVVGGAGWWAEALCTAFTVNGDRAARHLVTGDAAWGRTRAGDLVEFGAVELLGPAAAA
jgi:thiamine biosynthesis lipoprotein